MLKQRLVLQCADPASCWNLIQCKAQCCNLKILALTVNKVEQAVCPKCPFEIR